MGIVNWKRLGAAFEGAPRTVQLVSGRVRLVLARTVKLVVWLFVKLNRNEPLVSRWTPVSTGLETIRVWMIGTVRLSTSIWPVRLEALELKAKLTTPLVTPLIESHGWLVCGAKNPPNHVEGGR